MKIGLFQYYRVVAIFLVILIHQQFWDTGNMIGLIENWAVPLFSAISGCLYVLNQDRGFIVTVTQKAKRLLIPYMIWVILYFVANNIVLDVFIRHGNMRIPSISEWLIRGTANHLWFLTCLFLTFMLAGFLRLTARHVCKWEYRYHDVLWLIFVVTLGIASQCLPGETSVTFSGFVKIYLGRLVMYFGIGGIIACVFQRPCLSIIVGGAFLSFGVINLYIELFSGVCVQPLMAVIGMIAIAIGVKDVYVPSSIDKMAKMTMGVYLVHVLWTSLVNVVVQYLGDSKLTWFIAFPMTLLIYLVSILSVRWLPSLVRG